MARPCAACLGPSIPMRLLLTRITRHPHTVQLRQRKVLLGDCLIFPQQVIEVVDEPAFHGGISPIPGPLIPLERFPVLIPMTTFRLCYRAAAPLTRPWSFGSRQQVLEGDGSFARCDAGSCLQADCRRISPKIESTRLPAQLRRRGNTCTLSKWHHRCYCNCTRGPMQPGSRHSLGLENSLRG
jgi:hypothetical protein